MKTKEKMVEQLTNEFISICKKHSHEKYGEYVTIEQANQTSIAVLANMIFDLIAELSDRSVD